MNLSLFDYHLPQSRIAQEPVTPRDNSRLLIYDRKTRQITHAKFNELAHVLNPTDVLVMNDTKVFPARLNAQKETGGKIEVLLLHQVSKQPHVWEVLIGGRVKLNYKLQIKNNKHNDTKLEAKIVQKQGDGIWHVEFNKKEKEFWSIIDHAGETPIPPYVKQQQKDFKKTYQTVYAHNRGSAAAPTAGLHFTKSLLSSLKKKGVTIEYVTLHVGLGTFLPVKTKKIEQHNIHKEFAQVAPDVAKRLNQYKKEGRRIIVVGTTTMRTLEAFSAASSKLSSGAKWVDIFIYPPYVPRFTQLMITNFHLPKSSLLMMVSTVLAPGKKLAGIRQLKRIYETAIKKKYRFYSFGDGMFIN